MKQLLYSFCIGTIAVALCAPAAMAKEKDKRNKGKSAQVATARGQGQARAAVRNHGQRGYQQSLAHRRNIDRSAQSRAIVNRQGLHPAHGRPIREFNTASRNQTRERNFVRTNRTAVRERNNVVVSREQNFRANRAAVREANNVAVSRERNFRGNRTRELTRGGNVRITNNWRGDRFSGQHYAAFRNYSRHWHNRDWYRHNYSRIIFVSGGWWYWNTGYWYPAWGYAPGAYYPYDGPIYTGYASLSPHEVVVNVQVQLQHDGYYAGPIDGLLGPMTRRAIAAFQYDHGLAITSTIDEPTVSMLGVS